MIKQIYNRATNEGLEAYAKTEADIDQTYNEEHTQALTVFLQTYHTELDKLNNQTAVTEIPQFHATPTQTKETTKP